MRERTRLAMHQITHEDDDPSSAELLSQVDELRRTSKEYEEIRPILVDVLKAYCTVLERETGR